MLFSRLFAGKQRAFYAQRFQQLLRCAVMLRGQHLRVMAIQEVDDITTVVSGEDPVSIAMGEIADGTLGYEAEEFDRELACPDDDD